MVSDSWASRSERSLLDDDDESMEGDTLTPMMRRASSSDSNSLSHAFARSGAASAEFSRQHAAGDFGRLASASLESVLEEEHPILLRHLWQDPIFFIVAITAKLFQLLFISVPDMLLRQVPHAGSILSIISLYLFAQALALLWGFLAVAVAVASSRAMQSLEPTSADAACDTLTCLRQTKFETLPWYLWHLLRVLARCYQLYASLAVWWFLSRSLFELGWEMYGDFPRLRRILDANTYLPLAPLRAAFSPSTMPAHFNSPSSLPSSPAVVPAMPGGPGADAPRERKRTAWGSLKDFPRQPLRKELSGGGEDGGRGEVDGAWGGMHNLQRVLSESRLSLQAASAADADGEVLTASHAEVLMEGMRKEREAGKAIVRTVQGTFLIVPLVVLLALSLLLSSVQWAAALFETHAQAMQSSKQSPMPVGTADWGWVGELLVTATSRLSRTLRFTLFVGLLQYNQQFQALFPRWYLVLGKLPNAWAFKAMLALVGLPSSIRFFEWLCKPTGSTDGSTSGSGFVSVLLPLVPHTVLDNVLVMAWLALFLLAACQLLRLPRSALLRAGYRREIFENADEWCLQTVRFKGLVLFMLGAHFVRGLVSSRMGFTFAQNDQILISLQYPCLLVVIWVASMCAVVLRPEHLKMFPVLLAFSWVLSHYVAQVDEWGVVACCFLHLARAATMRLALESRVLQGMAKATLQQVPGARDAQGDKMCKAAAKGDLAAIRMLVGKGASVNACDYDSRSALHLAAAEGHVDVVQFLLSNNAVVRARDRWGGTPLRDAMRGRHATVEDLLRRAAASRSGVADAESDAPAWSEGDAREMHDCDNVGTVGDAAARPTRQEVNQGEVERAKEQAKHERVLTSVVPDGVRPCCAAAAVAGAGASTCEHGGRASTGVYSVFDRRIRVGPRRTYGFARQAGRFVVQVFLGISIWFFFLLQGLGLMSKFQAYKRLFPTSSMISLDRIDDNTTLIRHAISRLDLHATHEAGALYVARERERAMSAKTHARTHRWQRETAIGVGSGAAETRQVGRPMGGAKKPLHQVVADPEEKEYGDGERSPQISARRFEGMQHQFLPQYALCGARLWGLTTIDFGLLSLLAYFDIELNTHEALNTALAALFPAKSCDTERRRDEWTPGCRPEAPPVVVPHEAMADEALSSVFWTEVHFPEKGVTVIAVRGTEFWRVSDWLEDVRMWTEPVVFSLLSHVFPTIYAWSPQAHAMVTDTYHSLLQSLGLPDPEYKFHRLVRYIENKVKPRLSRLGEDSELVITGHSLGGGIAHIVAVMLNAPAVAFNPPGAYQSLSKHLYWNAKDRRQMHEAAHNRTVTVLAENDIIGKLFDTHGGLVQTITCSTDQIRFPCCPARVRGLFLVFCNRMRSRCYVSALSALTEVL